MSTLFVNNLNTASGTTIAIPSGKTLKAADANALVLVMVIQTVFDAHDTQVSQVVTFCRFFIATTITPKFSTSKIFSSLFMLMVFIKMVVWWFGIKFVENSKWW